ncbi:helix-hairpin-helix domain-containing protein [Dictyobacter kobayashii]|uniref:Soluble ligand binding domain-containing protein n=1 Tax=Dictyobacter kobayashii TaxID=2014872 RepID=A0A402AES3_9CHLR|nr:ComEA family DNA-binding protein [Dictyobacter kobayashii]GCE17586.1 hypothetical protein KDK_13860 [Dictyobacter kobayashii]
MMPFQSNSTPPRTMSLYDVSQQQTQPYTVPDESAASTSAELDLAQIPQPVDTIMKKQYLSRILAVVLVVALAGSIFWLWQPSSASSQQIAVTSTPGATTSSTQDTVASGNADNNGNIQVYIAGAVQHPGVYTLENQARVYQLLQAAGGPQPGANLAALNLATHLSDGQEVYVLHANETPVAGSNGTPGNSTQVTRVNVNTASADELRQALQISSKSAQTIVTYRLQHGPFLSVDTLAKVVSKTVYAKIKDMVTV